MHRLFAALRPPPAIRRTLRGLMAGVPGARWQDDEQLHLTIRFIGAVERPQADDIALALESLRCEPVEARLAGVGRFEHRGRTEALWAGLAPHDPLAALHRKVDQALVRAGLAPERRQYLPHITLARFSRSVGHGPAIERFLAEHAALASAPFVFTHLMLYESHLGHEGARYAPVSRVALG